ncbi:aminopeptidase N [Actinoallomurus bryophytorum]|uniref:Aminopeptidase N n=1 Tax=Actinoallomurus bryophytorum TaxID=1490222 RepID=A0A543BZW6_9ACTN|nr:aminopeptidase N [Actinoallomurus bryophytorum]TQL90371.1 membrane alanyl aminopeptidase [Actinoallomurus bryophytorum]
MAGMPALTRTEAQARARLLDVHSYTVHLDLLRGEEVFGSTTVIRFGCAEPGAATFVELRPAALRRVVLNGAELATETLSDGRLTLKGLAAENELRVEADMAYSRTGEGMHRFTDPADGEVYVYTQSAPDEASRVFACFDQPDLKAVLAVSVTAPPHWTVLSNGAGQRGDGGRWEFVPTPPISTYLAAVVAGPLRSVYVEHDGIPLGVHCRRSLAADLDADELFDITRRSFDRYHELFEERYPFGKYDQAFVPELNFGAMENPGCVTFRDEFLFRSAVTGTERETRAIVIAHEMAHMWFGDLVTMRWWDDLWLNESFAEYMGQLVIAEVTRFTTTWTGFAVKRKTWGYDADQRPSTHPVAAQGVDDTATARVSFDGISYAKGASVLRQLVAWVGEDAFQKGVNAYFARHRYGNADLADLLDALGGAADGRDVHGWAERWLRTSGVDTLRTEVADRDGELVSAEVVHTGTPGEPSSLRPHRIFVGLYDLAVDGDGGRRLARRERLDVDLAADGAGRTPLSRLTGAARPDLLLLNDGDLSYAKVRLDERSWRTVTAALSTVEDELTRALLWNTARDMTRDGELTAGDFLTLVETHLPGEPVVAVVEAVLAFARHEIADRYLRPGGRPAAIAALAEVCRRILRRAGDDDAAADVRLAAVRMLIQCSAAEDDLAALRKWLRMERVPGGPALDPELRWMILLQLSALGAAGEAEIAAELARDPSATGRQGAARCGAALPGTDSKERAWRGLFTDGALSNYLLTATAQGFWQPALPETTDGFIGRYFEEIPGAAGRGPMVETVLGRTFFPSHAAVPGTVRAAERCLDDGELPTALRRALTDQLDDLRRSVRVRDV